MVLSVHSSTCLLKIGQTIVAFVTIAMVDLLMSLQLPSMGILPQLAMPQNLAPHPTTWQP
jgi:hypothetical protein